MSNYQTRSKNLQELEKCSEKLMIKVTKVLETSYYRFANKSQNVQQKKVKLTDQIKLSLAINTHCLRYLVDFGVSI